MSEQPEEPGGGPPQVTVDDEQTIAVDAEAIAAWGARALQVLGVEPGAALFVTLVEPHRIAELKEQALGLRRPTDVLSFPMDDPADPSPGPVVLGDVVICPAVAAAQARTLGRTLDDELRELLVHGILHLIGRDHATPADELAMAREQRDAVASLVGARR